MASRDPNLLTEAARAGWFDTLNDYAEEYPDGPQPFITCTYRSFAEQDALYQQGRSAPGKIVTNARGGQSNHNYNPCPAFDIAFKDIEGHVYWDIKFFHRFASLATAHGLSWGGNWTRFKDYAHFQIEGESPNV